MSFAASPVGRPQRMWVPGLPHTGQTARCPAHSSNAWPSDLSGNESSQRVGGVLVQAVTRPVVPPRRPRVRMPCSVLDIAQTRSRVEAQRNEGMSEVVGVERVGLVRYSHLSQPPQYSPGFRAVPAAPRGRAEKRTRLSTINVRIDRLCRPGSQRDGRFASTLPCDSEYPMSALGPQVSHVRIQRLGDTKSVQPE